MEDILSTMHDVVKALSNEMLEQKLKEQFTKEAVLEKITRFRMDDNEGLTYAMNLLTKLDYQSQSENLKNCISKEINLQNFHSFMKQGKYETIIKYGTALGLDFSPLDYFTTLLKIIQQFERIRNSGTNEIEAEARKKINQALVELSLTCYDPQSFSTALNLASCSSPPTASKFLEDNKMPMEVIEDTILGLFLQKLGGEPDGILLISGADSASESKETKLNKMYTDEEIECLISAVEKIGKKWKKIKAISFDKSDRSRNQLRMKWNYLLLKAKEVYVDKVVSSKGSTETELRWYRKIQTIEKIPF